jgi:hypothetical protein
METILEEEKSCAAPAGLVEQPIETFQNRMVRGLPNDWGTCYRNAALQCMLSIPEYYRYWKQQHRGCPLSRSECPACDLLHLSRLHLDFDADALTVRGALMAFHETLRKYGDSNDDPELEVMLREDIGGSVAMFTAYVLDLFNPVSKRGTKGSAKGAARTQRLFSMKQRVTWTCEDCGKTFSHEGDSHGLYKMDDKILEPHTSG